MDKSGAQVSHCAWPSSARACCETATRAPLCARLRLAQVALRVPEAKWERYDAISKSFQMMRAKAVLGVSPAPFETKLLCAPEGISSYQKPYILAV